MEWDGMGWDEMGRDGLMNTLGKVAVCKDYRNSVLE